MQVPKKSLWILGCCSETWNDTRCDSFGAARLPSAQPTAHRPPARSLESCCLSPVCRPRACSMPAARRLSCLPGRRLPLALRLLPSVAPLSGLCFTVCISPRHVFWLWNWIWDRTALKPLKTLVWVACGSVFFAILFRLGAAHFALHIHGHFSAS